MKFIVLASLFISGFASANTITCDYGDDHITLVDLPRAPELQYGICSFHYCYGELHSKGIYVSSHSTGDIYDVSQDATKKQLITHRSQGQIESVTLTGNGYVYQNFSDCRTQP